MGSSCSKQPQSEYTGPRLKGKRHGEGTLKEIGPDGQSLYTGWFENGAKSGSGTLVDGLYVYSGHWRNDAPCGEGTEEHELLGKFESKRFGERMHDLAQFTTVSGIVYKGRFMLGNLEQGLAEYPSGATYEGGFTPHAFITRKNIGGVHLLSKFARHPSSSLNDFLMTQIKECFTSHEAKCLVPNEDVFRRHGRGLLTLPSGTTYSGEFQHGYPEGSNVTLNMPSGIVISGMFRQGKACGQGFLSIPKLGIHYEGGFVDNLPHGRGKLYVATALVPLQKLNSNSSCITLITYEGSWLNGKVSKTSTFTVTYPLPAELYEMNGNLQTLEDVVRKKQPNFTPIGYVIYQGSLNEGYQRHGTGKCWFTPQPVKDSEGISLQTSGSAPSLPIPKYGLYVKEKEESENESKQCMEVSESGETNFELSYGGEVQMNSFVDTLTSIERLLLKFGPSFLDKCGIGVGNGKILVYSGDWRYDVPKGTGASMLSNGSIHIGSWEHGLPHGEGRLVCGQQYSSELKGNGNLFTAGKIIEGEWIFGVFTKNITEDGPSQSKSKLSASQMAVLAQDLEWEQRHSRLEDPCRFCGEREANCLFLECAHLIFCKDCAEHMDHCALCDRPIIQRVHTFR